MEDDLRSNSLEGVVPMTTRLLFHWRARLEEVISQRRWFGRAQAIAKIRGQGVHRQIGSLHYITERENCQRSATYEPSDDLVLQQSNPL